MIFKSSGVIEGVRTAEWDYYRAVIGGVLEVDSFSVLQTSSGPTISLEAHGWNESTL